MKSLRCFIFRFSIISLLAAQAAPAIPAVLSLSSYLGGAGSDVVFGVAVDAGGDIYVVGDTTSTDFPGADVSAEPKGAVFVSRIAGDGRGLVFTTILDGKRTDHGAAIAVDDLRAAYVTGKTFSRDFPLLHPFQDNFNPGLAGPLVAVVSRDAFVTKLDASGSLVFSTFLGGRADEAGEGIAVDRNRRPYVAGATISANFPLKNEFQDAALFDIGNNAFLTVFAADGQSIDYSTQLGGTDSDFGETLTVDRAGNAYLVGDTESKDFPVKGPFQGSLQGGDDAWVAKINPAASGAASLVYSTYLGGTGEDRALGIAVDAAGQAHVTGITGSSSFPLVAPPGLTVPDSSITGDEAFVTKFNAQGNALLFSTFLGGAGTDRGNSIAVDTAGAEYVVGLTTSTNFPVVNEFQSAFSGAQDAFVAKIDPLAAVLRWSSYHGGFDVDNARAVALDSRGNVYVGGETFSGSTLPRVAAFQDAFGGGESDGFVTRIRSTAVDTIGVLQENAGKILLRNSNTAGAADFTVTLGQTGDLPIAANWFGFGSRPGVFRAGTFILKRFNSDILCCNLSFAFGQAGDLPVAGDWDGDGIDSVGVFRPSTGEWLLRNSLSAGPPDVPVFSFGASGDLPVAGDWDGDGVDTIGVFRPTTGQWFLRNSNASGNPDLPIFVFGIAPDLPVTGDWDGDGVTTIGVLRGNEFLLSNDGGAVDLDFVFGNGGGRPIAGDWDGRP